MSGHFKITRRAGIALLFAGGCSLKGVNANTLSMPSSGFNFVLGDILRPDRYHQDFCKRYPSQCGNPTNEPVLLEMSAYVWDLLNKINNKINAEIEYRSDWVNHRVEDRWDLAETRRGDCDEYVWLKRKLLMEAGLSECAVLPMLIKYTEPPEYFTNDFHFILVVRFKKFDVILDNIRDVIITPDQMMDAMACAIIDPNNPRQFRQVIGMQNPRSPDRAPKRINAGFIQSPYTYR